MVRTVCRRPGRRALAWPRRGLLLVTLVAALVAAAPPAHAMGQKEDPLRQADALIEQRNYDAAILFLKDFIEKNPERFDEAQKRLRLVIDQREAYNQKALELIQVLRDDPTNEARKLALIADLRKIDPNPNPETTDFIAKTKEAAAFVYNKAQFEKILSTGRGLIDQAKYAEAASTYAEGFVLYREEFDSGPYDQLTKASVASLVERLKAEVSNYAAAQANLGRVVEGLRSAFVAADPEAAAAAWPEALGLLQDRANRRNSVVGAGQTMARQFDTLLKLSPGQQDAAKTDSSFLPFAFRFTLGRSTSPLPEGIAGSMDSQWLNLVDGLQKAYETALNTEYTRAIAAYAASDWEGAAGAFDKASAIVGVGLQILGLWSLPSPTESVPELGPYWKSILQDKPGARARDSHLAAVSSSAARLSRILASAETTAEDASAFSGRLRPDSPLAASLAALTASRLVLVDLEAKIAAEARVETELARQLQGWQAQGLTVESSQTAQVDLAAKIQAASTAVLAKETAILSSALGFEYGKLAAELSGHDQDTASSRLLLDGQPGQAGQGDQAGAALAPLAKYPGKAAGLLTAQGLRLADLRSRLAAYTKKIAAEAPRVAPAPELQSWAAKGRELEAMAAELETQRAGLLARAQDQKRLADSARQEAERRVTESRNALAAQDFDIAIDRLNKAQDRYLASFAIEENPELRAQWDSQGRKLSEDIGTARRAKATADINRLIKEGVAAFYQENYTKAEESLTQARTLRKDVFNLVDPEVEVWIGRAESALKTTTGRTIDPNNPLYAEMSQLISLARTYYNQGQALLAQKRKPEALVTLGQARDKINQVKIVFPINQEAGVLALRVDQVIDPVAFKQQFAEKFAKARADIKAPTRETKATLDDLSAIDPTYPGLKDALRQVNEALNPRNLVVVDPARQREARALVTSAKAIVDSGDTARFQIAFDQISRAINLDPTNPQAGDIKDRVLTYLGAATQAVLSSAAEEQYRLAVSEFQASNFVLANAIVDRLLADARNRGSQKLNDLSKKIKARL